MKTGKPTRLSEKLNAELDQIRQDHTALMTSQLKSFENDLNNIAQSAKRTIETDTAQFLFHNRNVFEERIEQIRTWLRYSPWIITGMVGTGIALMMVASWFWVGIMTRSELKEMGLSRIDQTNGTWLFLNPDMTELKTCTVVDRPFICIEIKEN